MQKVSAGRVGGREASRRIETKSNLQIKDFPETYGLDTCTGVRCQCMPLEEHSGLLDHQRLVEI